MIGYFYDLRYVNYENVDIHFMNLDEWSSEALLG
jgi:hypothetical protein